MPLDDEYGFRLGGMVSFQLHRREELARWAMGDVDAVPPANSGASVTAFPSRRERDSAIMARIRDAMVEVRAFEKPGEYRHNWFRRG